MIHISHLLPDLDSHMFAYLFLLGHWTAVQCASPAAARHACTCIMLCYTCSAPGMYSELCQGLDASLAASCRAASPARPVPACCAHDGGEGGCGRLAETAAAPPSPQNTQQLCHGAPQLCGSYPAPHLAHCLSECVLLQRQRVPQSRH